MACLAPSTRNTKPWQFHQKEEKITLHPDFSRWLPFDDPQQKQLYLSLGCALENLLIALKYQGWKVETDCDLEGKEPSIHVHLKSKGAPTPSPLFEAIEKRHTYMSLFASQKISGMDRLAEIGGGQLLLSEDNSLKRAINELCVQTDIDLFLNPKFCSQVRQLDQPPGSYSEFFILKLQMMAARLKGISTPSIMESAPTLGLFLVEKAAPLNWVRCGQMFERLFLEVTHLGLKLKPYSICLREKAGQEQVANLFNVKADIPALLFCVGYPISTRGPHRGEQIFPIGGSYTIYRK
ncbi:MAG: putative NAD(P)H nitroreductase [Chlamydiae bacterium]|nr:putative NAD(P)H nitroreductase [Chlamydiota bacterium]